MNYSEFWYLSLIFYKLIRILIFLLHTFSMGEKTSARLNRERTVRLHYAQWFSLPPTVRAGDVTHCVRGKVQNVPTPIFDYACAYPSPREDRSP